MKNVCAIFSGVFIFCSCSTSIPEIYKVDPSALNDVILMPFYSDSGDLGYINPETLKIIIPGQYERAGPFVGDFAVVSKDGKERIINKNTKTVLSKFHDAFLFASEDGTTVFAVTANYAKVRRHDWGAFNSDYRPTETNYRLYNLNAGKLVIDKNTRGYNVNDDYMPKIMFFSHYLAYDEDLYEIKSDGTLEKSKISMDDAVSQIIEERKLSHIEINYSYNRNYSFESYFKYSDNPDQDLLSKMVPAHMKIKRTTIINRNKMHPLKENNLLYNIRLEGEGWKDYAGLYDAANNKWVVPPTDGREFSATVYDDWVVLERWNGSGYSDDYYNIKERKAYKGLHRKQEFTGIMTYYGYSRGARTSEEINIEDF
jgi:hypothetical protein